MSDENLALIAAIKDAVKNAILQDLLAKLGKWALVSLGTAITSVVIATTFIVNTVNQFESRLDSKASKDDLSVAIGKTNAEIAGIKTEQMKIQRDAALSDLKRVEFQNDEMKQNAEFADVLDKLNRRL